MVFRGNISFRHNNRPASGFTLIEILIVMSLLLMLVTIAAIYNKAAGRQILVSREHAHVLALFVRARSAGLTIPKTDLSVERICAYGVHVDIAAHAVILFKDLGTPGDSGSCAAANNRYDGDAELVDRFVLDPTVTLTATGIADMVFIPPSGDVVITDSSGQREQSATVTIGSVEAGFARGIRVNTFGQITEFGITS